MKRILLALALLLSPSLAGAQLVKEQVGTVGVKTTCTNMNGASVICVQPGVTVYGAGGVSGGQVVGGSFTRPADTTAYASGDLVATSTTAGSVVPLSFAVTGVNAGSANFLRIRLSTNHTGLAGTDTFRVHIFKNSPTVANGDNGAFSVNGIAAIETSKWDCTLDAIYTDGAKGWCTPLVGNVAVFDAATSSTLAYVLLEARGAYPPTSGEIFTVAIEEWPN